MGVIIYLVLTTSFTLDIFKFNFLRNNNTFQRYHEIINIIDLDTPIIENFSCVKTKRILQTVRTTICPHNASDYVSYHFWHDSIYEEQLLSIILRLLIYYPEYGFIDIGGNIGTYTLFVAKMNRFVITIECFRPNYLRIAKAIQTEGLQQQVILIGNAIYSESRRYLSLSSDPSNIGGQGIQTHRFQNESLTNPYIVKTIRFDDLLPVIKEMKTRSFFMKMDIEGSEYYVFNTSTQAFDYLTISVIMMEWTYSKYNGEGRGSSIIDFLTSREYIPTENLSHKLNLTSAFTNWPVNVFWVKNDHLDKFLFI